MSEKKSGIEKVKEFMLLCKQPINNKPSLSDSNTNLLRIDLLSEELRELNLAVSENNKTEILDALIDLQYVLYGAVLTFGMQDVWKDAFQNVHDSNMSKFCKTEEEAEATIEMYLKKGISVYFEKVGDLFIVYRTSDKKVMKSIDYIPASLSKFVQDVTSDKSSR